MISKRLRSLVVILFLIFSLALVLVYIWANKNLIILLGNISWQIAVCLIILRFLFLSINGLFLKLFAARLNVQLKCYEWIGLPFITTMGNYLTPLSGGMLARAAYLKNRHGLSYTHFTTLLAANYMITFLISIILGLFILPLIWHQVYLPWLLLILFIVSCGLIIAILIMPIPCFSSTNRLTRILNHALVGWQKVRSDHRLVYQLILVTIITLLLNAAAFWLSYWALNVAITAPAAIIVSLSTVFSTFTTLTPGNLGIREAFISLTSEIVGVGVGAGLLVALLIRGSTLVSAFTLGPIFSAILARKIRLTPLNSGKITPNLK